MTLKNQLEWLTCRGNLSLLLEKEIFLTDTNDLSVSMFDTKSLCGSELLFNVDEATCEGESNKVELDQENEKVVMNLSLIDDEIENEKLEFVDWKQ